MAIRISRFSSSLAALALAATVLVFSACSGPDQTRQAAGVSVGVRTEPHPAELGDNTFLLWVTRDGNKADGAAVRVRLYMPGMPMSSDTTWIDAQPTGGGKYRAVGDFSMGGDWQVEVAVTPADGAPVALAFPFQIAWKLK